MKEKKKKKKRRRKKRRRRQKKKGKGKKKKKNKNKKNRNREKKRKIYQVFEQRCNFLMPELSFSQIKFIIRGQTPFNCSQTLPSDV